MEFWYTILYIFYIKGLIIETSIREITEKINTFSKDYEIGKLQNIRKDLHQAQKLASKNIFDKRTISNNWAFHYGGRKELQFNIGLEKLNNESYIRFGVAFSLELSQSLPKIDILIPKIALFNDYIQDNLKDFNNMKMWHYSNDTRSTEYSPTSIQADLVKENVFIFLGIMQPLNALDYKIAIEVMNKLLPLYIFTESNKNNKLKKESFEFKQGCKQKLSFTKSSLAQRELNITLRHNDIQNALFQKLLKIYDEKNIGTEIPDGNGGYIDLVVKFNNYYHFYEIKTAHTAKACIRQAIGQLLEYAYWTKQEKIEKLIIIGEPVLDTESKTYLKTLQSKFSLPIDYKSIQV